MSLALTSTSKHLPWVGKITVCATASKFCYPHPVHLKMAETASSTGYNISCSLSGDSLFVCNGKWYSRFMWTRSLADISGKDLVHFGFRPPNKVDAFSDKARKNKLFSAKIESGGMKKIQLSAEFLDKSTLETTRVVLQATDTGLSVASLYLGEPKEGSTPLAKIERSVNPATKDLDEYTLDIEAGVDVALVIVLCVAMDNLKDVTERFKTVGRVALGQVPSLLLKKIMP